ncbi:hypothetical protein [Vibrio taketomensis]|nr:hypothetical protein [Vibrio taketomensis]
MIAWHRLNSGIAVAYASDTNTANSYLGIEGDSDIQVGGSFDQHDRR